jgi:hypothetical protein
VDNPSFAPLVAAVIAAVAAVMGYWANQYANRREGRVRTYAEALQALSNYEELPFLIWRRLSLNDATLVERMSELWARVRYYESLLQVDSSAVGAAYTNLANATRFQGKPFRKIAWDNPARDKEHAHKPPTSFRYNTQMQRNLCLLAMRRELKPWGALMRASTKRSVKRSIHSGLLASSS